MQSGNGRTVFVPAQRVVIEALVVGRQFQSPAESDAREFLAPA
jgi:hypothetical protein